MRIREDSPNRARQPRRLDWVLTLLTWAVAGVVVVSTFFSLHTLDAGMQVATVAVTAVVITLWIVVQFLPDARPAVGMLVAIGVLGAGLDYLNPEGPGYIVVFMAIAAIAGRYPLRISAPAAGVPAAASVVAELLTSHHPLSSVLNICIGVGFVFATATFARASQDAHALAAALLREQEAAQEARERAVVLGERSHLARELHDVLAHTLSGLSLQLAGAALLADRTGADPALTKQVGLAQATAREGLVNAQRAIEALRGEGALPGPENLDALIDGARRAGDIQISYVVEGTAVPVSPEVGLTIYRAVQESLTNVTRHAGRHPSVRVTASWSSGAVSVEVVDSGGDGQPAGLPPSGWGLRGLADRCARVGGQLETGPCGSGWRVRLTVPVRAAAADSVRTS